MRVGTALAFFMMDILLAAVAWKVFGWKGLAFALLAYFLGAIFNLMSGGNRLEP